VVFPVLDLERSSDDFSFSFPFLTLKGQHNTRAK